MTAPRDRKLLELAAKAAGIEIPQLLRGRPSPWYWIDDRGIHKDVSGGGDGTSYWHWNPLESDADAFRLQCALGIDIGYGFDGDKVSCVLIDGEPTYVSDYDNDPCKTTREAIVRAAAEIGRNLT